MHGFLVDGHIWWLTNSCDGQSLRDKAVNLKRVTMLCKFVILWSDYSLICVQGLFWGVSMHTDMWPDLGKPSIWDFSKSWAWCMVDKLYHRANPCSSLTPIAHFVVEIQHFVCDRATPPIIEKLRSKGVAMHAYGVSAYYAWTGNQLNGPGWGPFEMNIKIEQELNFVV